MTYPSDVLEASITTGSEAVPPLCTTVPEATVFRTHDTAGAPETTLSSAATVSVGDTVGLPVTVAAGRVRVAVAAGSPVGTGVGVGVGGNVGEVRKVAVGDAVGDAAGEMSDIFGLTDTSGRSVQPPNRSSIKSKRNIEVIR